MKVAIVNLGQIVSGDWRNPFASGDTIVSDGERIVSVGTASAQAVEAADVVIDAGGMTAIPGLIDSHVHITFGDYTPRQRTVGYLESYLQGGTTTCITASEVHVPGRPRDPERRIEERHAVGWVDVVDAEQIAMPTHLSHQLAIGQGALKQPTKARTSVPNPLDEQPIHVGIVGCGISGFLHAAGDSRSAWEMVNTPGGLCEDRAITGGRGRWTHGCPQNAVSARSSR